MGDLTVETDTPSFYTGHKNGDTAAQSRVLNAIGDALKNRRIDFHIATRLRDLVRSGRVNEAEGRLQRFQEGPKL